MSVLKHFKEAVLMVWEVNPYKRKENRKVNINEIESHKLKVGDSVSTGLDDGNREKLWVVAEILSVRPASLSGYNYYETMCDFKRA